MKRRDFVRLAASCGAWGVLSNLPASAGTTNKPAAWPVLDTPTCALPTPLDTIAGMTLPQLRADYHHRLFNQYLPFWDKGGYDRERGGFMCELNNDGSVANDEKYIWYQGRGIWVYSTLYAQFGRDRRWLEIARKSKDFMLRHMYAGQGRWVERVRRDGSGTGALGENIYGWLFAAAGLTALAQAADDRKCLDLAKESILAAVRRYDEPDYAGGFIGGDAYVDPPKAGLRSQGHSMIFLWVLTQWLRQRDDAQLAELQATHVDAILNRFWNPKYGVSNEYLLHDYSRVPGAEAYMYAGHSLETLWMMADEALRLRDRKLFDTAKARIRRYIEMCWDYVFEGWGSEDFLAVATDKHPYGPKFSVKTMWAHTEILLASMMMLEYTGECWAKEWYERARAFTLRTMPIAGHGVWRQAVNRMGEDLQRIGISTTRRCNFHQPRYLMRNLLTLDRLIAQQGQLTPFPGT